jgi:hypothetical protein
MKDLSITQEYMLCALSEKGRLPWIGREVSACLLAGAMIELLVAGCIRMDEKKKVLVTGKPGAEMGYLNSLFDWLNGPKALKLETVAQEICISFTDKRLTALVAGIGASLAERGCVSVEMNGFLSRRPRYVPKLAEVDKVIQKIRAEMLEDGVMTDETVALVSLLEKSSRIRMYFSRYEAKQLKDRLKEIKQAPSNQLIRQMIGYVETMMACLIASASAASSSY